jgi:transposase
MRDSELYRRILGLASPWQVDGVELDLEEKQVVVEVGRAAGTPLSCPHCERECPGYDTRSRQWRHLDTCQYRTILSCRVPRCECPEHGVVQVDVPWAEEGSRFTALFERLVIDWMLVAGRAGVTELMDITWPEANGIMQRAVRRGLERRKAEVIPILGVDEKSFQGREFVTIACDIVYSRVLYVGEGRSEESLDGFYQSLTAEQLAGIEFVTMDMCQAYVASTEAHVENADQKIIFDKFHVAKNANAAVDKVRRAENKELKAEGDERLNKTKYGWLRNPENESAEQKQRMAELRESNLRTARGWAIKETLAEFWDQTTIPLARQFFHDWYSWAIRSRLDPIKRLAKTLKERLDGLLNYFRCPVTNAAAESLNSKIQFLKYRAHGFKSIDGLRNAIYFHLGGLDLHPHKS